MGISNKDEIINMLYRSIISLLPENAPYRDFADDTVKALNKSVKERAVEVSFSYPSSLDEQAFIATELVSKNIKDSKMLLLTIFGDYFTSQELNNHKRLKEILLKTCRKVLTYNVEEKYEDFFDYYRKEYCSEKGFNLKKVIDDVYRFNSTGKSTLLFVPGFDSIAMYNRTDGVYNIENDFFMYVNSACRKIKEIQKEQNHKEYQSEVAFLQNLVEIKARFDGMNFKKAAISELA